MRKNRTKNVGPKVATDGLFCWRHKQFLMWHYMLCYSDSSQFWYFMRGLSAQKQNFQKTQTLSDIKRFWRSLILIPISFQSLGINYLHGLNIRSVRVEKSNLVDMKPFWKSLQKSLAKGNFSVIVLVWEGSKYQDYQSLSWCWFEI